MEALDPTDIRLLDALQKDAQLTTQELGGKLGLSASQTGRRRQRPFSYWALRYSWGIGRRDWQTELEVGAKIRLS